MSKKKANAPTSNTIALNKKAKHEYQLRSASRLAWPCSAGK